MIGPKIMAHLPPVPIPSWFLFTYNFALVGLSIYMCEEVSKIFYLFIFQVSMNSCIYLFSVKILVGVYQTNYNLVCAEITHSPNEMKITNALWWYFFSKAIELLDTVWMILRKRNLQVTFLHVFHHATMVGYSNATLHWLILLPIALKCHSQIVGDLVGCDKLDPR